MEKTAEKLSGKTEFQWWMRNMANQNQLRRKEEESQTGYDEM